jgi:hypothetical protein
MKNFLFALGICLLLPGLSRADLPTRDLAVHMAQETFAEARNPSRTELQQGRSWTCSRFSARPGEDGASNAVLYDALQFVPGPENAFVDHGVADTGVYRFREDGELSSKSAQLDVVVKFLRGALVLELSKESAPENQRWAHSVARPQNKVFEYFYCLLSRYQKGDAKAFNAPKGWL